MAPPPPSPMPPSTAKARLGRAVQVLGLVLMPVGLLWGMSREDGLGPELLLAGVGFLLVMTGRGMQG